MKMPDGPISGTIFALGRDVESVARKLGSRYDGPELFEEESDAWEYLRYSDGGMSVFKVDVSITNA